MTKTELCNRTLGFIGHDRTITDYDGQTEGVYNDRSTEAIRCRLFLPVAIADCLAEHNWDFAARERRYDLAWQNADGYATIQRPADCARLVAVMDSDERPIKVKQANGLLYIKKGEATASVTVRWVSSDADLDDWPPKFADAVVAKLAELISGPMFGDASKTNAYMQLAQQRIAAAITAEADETSYKGETVNPLIKARG